MSEPRRADPAAAGLMLVVTILLCAGAGLGLGALAGIALPLGLAGFFVGLVVGFLIVHSRFKDI